MSALCQKQTLVAPQSDLPTSRHERHALATGDRSQHRDCAEQQEHPMEPLHEGEPTLRCGLRTVFPVCARGKRFANKKDKARTHEFRLWAKRTLR